jgi:hypothetical protein
MRHGISVDLILRKHGGNSGMQIEGQHFPFEYDEEKLFLQIQKPTWEDLDYYDCFEITSPYNDTLLNTVNSRRAKRKLTCNDIPIVEWRRRLAIIPEEIVTKTLECTTQ